MTVGAVIVHGGAGSVPEERRAAHVAGCARAVEAGLEVLRAGGSALDAAQRAVEVLEDDPLFNAGYGACLNEAGEVELDAAVMDGAGLRFGGVCAMPPVRHPIAVARALLEEGRHALLADHGADAFAVAHGFERLSADALITPAARARLEAVRAGRAESGWAGGTVGAVAWDGAHVAAATSTGGMVGKARGRIGDSPIPGAGTLAEDGVGGVSATGHGEAILRSGTGHHVVAALRAGASASDAAASAIAALHSGTGSTGGVIVLDGAGRPGRANNTETMSWAYGTSTGERDAGW